MDMLGALGTRTLIAGILVLWAGWEALSQFYLEPRRQRRLDAESKADADAYRARRLLERAASPHLRLQSRSRARRLEYRRPEESRLEEVER